MDIHVTHFTLKQWHAACETAAETRFNCPLRMWLPALCCSQYLVIFWKQVHSYFLPFLSHSVEFILGNILWWQCGRLHVTGYTTFLTWLLSSVAFGISKSIAPCILSFGKVLGNLQ
jgi:hypothetical protein